MTNTTSDEYQAEFLRSIRVIDFGNNIAGPCVATILGGLGAEVIKVERPGTGDVSRIAPPFAGRSGITYQRIADPDEDQIPVAFIKRNRGKASVTLDLNLEDDRRRFIDLVATADVMVENGLPGALVKLGVGYETLKARNPDLILCSVTGFGQTGPCRRWAAYDAIVQSHAGTFTDVVDPDGASGVALADMAGATYAVIAVLAALVGRLRGASGVWLDVSMLEATLAFAWESNRDVVQRQREAGHRVRRVAPWNSYPAADGRVMICAYTDRQFGSLKSLIGLDDARFDDRLERIRLVDELDAIVGEWTVTRPKWEVAQQLQEIGVPSSPVLHPLEVRESPQIRARGALRQVVHPRLGPVDVVAPEFPLWINETHHLHYSPLAPELGQDNERLDDLIAQRGEPARSIS